MFIADDLTAWLVGMLADAGRKKLTSLVLGDEQERALLHVATEAISLTARHLRPEDDEAAESLAMVIDHVFHEPIQAAFREVRESPATLIEMLRSDISAQLMVLDDRDLTSTGQSSADILGIPSAVIAEDLTGHLVREILVRGSRRGPLTPLANQVNHDITHLQGRRLEQMVGQLAEELRELRGALAAESFDVDISIADYKRLLAERFLQVQILDMPTPLDLTQAYVELKIREINPTDSVADHEIGQSHADGPRAAGLDHQLIGHETAKPVSPKEALRQFKRMNLVGDPGAGKTTMLKYIACLAAHDDLLPEVTFPLYVEARRFADSGASDMLSYVADELLRSYRFTDAQEAVERQLDNGNAILLLDGLDEVLASASVDAAEAAYSKVLQEAQRLVSRFPRAYVIMTCRRAAWRTSSLPQFQAMELLDFDRQGIAEFISKRFAAEPVKASGLRAALAENPELQALAANPLLLALISISYDRELMLPECRAELYAEFADVLLGEWDARRGIKRFSKFSIAHKRELLAMIAWHFHTAGRRYFRRSEVLSVTGDFLRAAGLDRNAAPDMLSEISLQHGVLKEFAHGWYGFLHLTLQEYFAALAVSERGVAPLKEVADRRHDPWWEEAIVLLSGQLEDASPLLLALLGRMLDSAEPAGHQPLAVDDDMFHADLFLCARCLAEAPRVRLPWLSARILAELRDIWRRSPYDSQVRSAAKSLVRISGEAHRSQLLTAIGDETVGFHRRAVAVQAFAVAGQITAAPRLLEMLKRRQDKLDEVSGAIASALGSLRYQDALRVMLQMMDDAVGRLHGIRTGASLTGEHYDPLLVAVRVADALSELPAEASHAALWSIVDQTENEHDAYSELLMSTLIAAIGKNAEPDDMPRLSDLAVDRIRSAWLSHVADEAISVLARTDSDAIARRLLTMLHDPHIQNNDTLPQRIASALATLRNPVIMPAMLDALCDAGLLSFTRYQITVALRGYPPQACEDELARLLTAVGVDDLTKFGIAVVLADWKNSAGFDLLQSAFANDELKNRLSSSASTHTLLRPFWREAATALHRLGDETIVPTLLAWHEQALRDRDYDWAEQLAIVLDDFQPVELVRRLVSPEYLPLTPLAAFHLARALTKPAVPMVIGALAVSLEPGTFESWAPFRRGSLASDMQKFTRMVSKQIGQPSFLNSVIFAIGRIADDVHTAAELLRILLRQRDQRASSTNDVLLGSVEETLFEVLEKVCRRTRVRASWDGNIIASTESLQADCPPLAELVEVLVRSRIPWVAELDPYVLSTRPSPYGNTDTYGHRDDYVPRQADGLLAEALHGAGLIVVTGPPAVGKTRTAFEALRRSEYWNNARLVFPVPGAIGRLADHPAFSTPGPIVIWLDDLRRFLPPGGELTPALLARILSRPGKTVVLASLSQPRPAAGDRSLELEQDAEAVISQGVVVDLGSTHDNPSEQTLATRAYPELSPRSCGLGEMLAGTPELLHAYNDAITTDPLMRLIAEACVDWARCGADRPIPEHDLLNIAREILGSERGDIEARDEDLAAALDRARKPLAAGSHVALITAQPTEPVSYTADSYLIEADDGHDSTVAPRPVSEATWTRILSRCSDEDAFNVGLAAHERGNIRIAIDATRRAAEAGFTRAQTNLGLMLKEQDPEQRDEARRWLVAAANTGDLHAQNSLGLLAIQRIPPDLEDARRWYTQAAEAGDVWAQHNLGLLFAEHMVPPDLDQARTWWTLAAEAGHPPSQFNLALLLSSLDPPEIAEARAWYTLAAEAGEVEAQHNLGLLLVTDVDPHEIDQARFWLTKAAAAGLTTAQLRLGFLLAEQIDPPELKEARFWLAKAATAGDIKAMNYLGTLAVRGNPPQVEDARSFWESAAEAGDIEAQFRLGVLFSEIIDPPDVGQARKWLTQAAEAGHVTAQTALGILLFRQQAPPEPDEASRWLEQAAAAGNNDAKYNLGVLASAQEPPDIERTLELWTQAARANHTHSQYMLGKVTAAYARDPAEVNRALFWLRRAAEAGHAEALSTLAELGGAD